MSIRYRPVVYCESSLAADEVLGLLPGCCLRPSVRRGDLYRDRALGYGVFLLLDGVFMQHQAVSPREIIDVLKSGALVAGASSMGALRAAECWPLGMRGVGSIYRLFRRGRLDSDDEVVVMFSPVDGAPLTVALVNVRFAVAQLVRTGGLSATDGRRIVEAARQLFFADRTWSAILAAAGLAQRSDDLQRRLAAFDLKRRDALTAVRRLARWLHRPEELGVLESPGPSVFLPSEMMREPEPASHPGVKSDTRVLLEWALVMGGRWSHSPESGDRINCLHRLHSGDSTHYLTSLMEGFERSGCLLESAMQLQAIEAAEQWLAEVDMPSAQPPGPDVAANELARFHGHGSWQALLDETDCVVCLQHLEDAFQRLRNARRVREAWFAPAAAAVVDQSGRGMYGPA